MPSMFVVCKCKCGCECKCGFCTVVISPKRVKNQCCATSFGMKSKSNRCRDILRWLYIRRRERECVWMRSALLEYRWRDSCCVVLCCVLVVSQDDGVADDVIHTLSQISKKKMRRRGEMVAIQNRASTRVRTNSLKMIFASC